MSTERPLFKIKEAQAQSVFASLEPHDDKRSRESKPHELKSRTARWSFDAPGTASLARETWREDTDMAQGRPFGSKRSLVSFQENG